MRLNRCIHKIKTAEMAEFDLKSPHVSCLYYLYKSGAMTAKELCDVCHEDKGAMSRSLDYLEQRGFILCDSAAKKRYRAPLTLTDEGRRIGASIAQKVDSILDKASEGLDEESRTTMYESLALIDENLQKICEEYEG